MTKKEKELKKRMQEQGDRYIEDVILHGFDEAKKEKIPKIDMVNFLAELLGDNSRITRHLVIKNYILLGIIAVMLLSWIGFYFYSVVK